MKKEMIDFETNLFFALNDIDGKQISNSNAKPLVSKSKGDPIKFWGLALLLSEGTTLNLNGKDKAHLKGLIKENNKLPMLLKNQLLSVVE